MKAPISDGKWDQLTQLQHRQFADGVPVLILVEGCGGYLMGQLVNEIMSLLEPRGVEYHHFRPTKERYDDAIFDYLVGLPAKGRLGLYDRGWYCLMFDCTRSSSKEQGQMLETIQHLERYMADNGIVIVKLYLDMDDDLMRTNEASYPVQAEKRCGSLSDDASKSGDYCATKRTVRAVLDATDTPYAPWDVITVGDYARTVEEMVDRIISRLGSALDSPYVPAAERIVEQYTNPRTGVDLSIKADDYGDQLERLQSQLASCQCRLARSDRSLVVVFEGWDAAGKGGAIKRVTAALNPRGYRAVPIGVPTAEEKSHTHLWRFCSKMPKQGQITIFDRSWYGRMMVEPIEGFCTEAEYERSGREINVFEEEIVKNGAILVKFWMEVSKEEQLKRFNERQDDPMKQWKITDEDWRNRGKWDVYEKYVDSMMKQTSTPVAPWTVVESEDKRYARLKVLRTLIDAVDGNLK
jgi:polyphosphate kinase 2